MAIAYYIPDQEMLLQKSKEQELEIIRRRLVILSLIFKFLDQLQQRAKSKRAKCTDTCAKMARKQRRPTN